MSTVENLGLRMAVTDGNVATTYTTEAPADTLSKKAAQLSALLSLTIGSCGESFRDTSDSIQENVLWLAAELAREVEMLSAIAVDTAKEATSC